MFTYVTPHVAWTCECGQSNMRECTMYKPHDAQPFSLFIVDGQVKCSKCGKAGEALAVTKKKPVTEAEMEYEPAAKPVVQNTLFE